VLTLRAGGGADLTPLSNPARVLWASEGDPEFLAELGHGVIDENDIGEVLEYLCEVGHMTGTEADRCEVDVEALAPGTFIGGS
jgi:hypothetical protein